MCLLTRLRLQSTWVYLHGSVKFIDRILDKMENIRAFVLGYTGETGKVLLKELAQDGAFQNIVLIGRRKIDLPEEFQTKFVQETIDFDKVEEHKDAFKDCTVGFCCLGTTKGKAGAKNFVKVDRDYVYSCAMVAKETGCQHFHLMTSIGANKNSMFLYPKTKGEIEEKVAGIKFPKLSIYRPAFLMCDRVESRPGERFVLALLTPVAKLSPTTATVPVEYVARAMIQRAKQPSASDSELLENAQIHELGKQQQGQ